MTPTTPSEPRHVRIQAAGPTARLEVDGHDIADQVASYQLQHTAGQPPELLLLLRPTADPQWEGAARIVVGADPDPGPAAAAFLAALDPAETERAVLDRHDLQDGGPNEFVRALLLQLTEWALGKRQPAELEKVAG
ncbi:hypothetical protein [Kitasatospora purpeofusca]|uniref:hypothetical protein n=1 Tax=Kitasatospora purpeofusca TaxID=67352 RepID=UPI002A59EBC3|nr:hypothetical protein [Kitasatospora purpeofusca]MDY0811454.1 hypothetical protein [Kitasatospora purpeofusca]